MDHNIINTVDYANKLGAWTKENDITTFQVRQLPEELKSRKWLMKASCQNYIRRTGTDNQSKVCNLENKPEVHKMSVCSWMVEGVQNKNTGEWNVA